MRYIILLCLLIISHASHAREANFIRDYTYRASDLDSKVSARENTLKLIKAGVLEEIVTYVSNNSSLEQSQVGHDFRRTFIQQTSASSAGFLKTRILQEDWDGFEMTIKAEVTADPEKIRDELERVLALNAATRAHQAPLQPDRPIFAQGGPDQSRPLMHVSATTPDYSRYVRRAQLTQAYSLLGPLKLTMTEYYMINGEWPSSLKQLHLSPDEMSDGQYLDKVRLAGNGRIIAHLSDTFGKNKTLTLTPRSIMGGMQTRWDCSTNVSIKGAAGLDTLNCKQGRRPR